MTSVISKHRATILVDGDIELRVEDVSVTLDRNWSPYARATIVMPIPSDDILALLDPREGARVTLTLFQDFGDTYRISALTQAWPAPGQLWGLTAAYPDPATLAELSAQYRNPLNPNVSRTNSTRPLNLGIRERRIDQPQATLTLLLASDEAMLQDLAPAGTAPVTLGLTSVRDTVEYVLDMIGATLTAGTEDDTVEVDSTIWEPDVTGWDFLESIIQKSGLRLWCDESRAWRLDDAVEVLPGTLALSYQGTMTAASDTLSRNSDGWCDAVVVKYEWTEPDGTRQVAYDSATAVGGGSKVLTVSHRDTRYPGPGAAANILRHQANRGRTVEVDAVSDYAATPGTACVITLEDTPAQTGIVAGVTWRMPADEMRLTFRDLSDTPPGAYLLANPAMAYDDAPAGVTYEAWTNPDGD